MPRVVNPSKASSAASAVEDGGGGVGLKPPPPLPQQQQQQQQPTTSTTSSTTHNSKLLKKTNTTTTTLQRSLKSTIQFKSDLTKSTRSTWSCGILHATITSAPPTIVVGGSATTITGGGGGGVATPSSSTTVKNGTIKEEHCFVWISNLFHLDKALDHLKKFGFYQEDDDDNNNASLEEEEEEENGHDVKQTPVAAITVVPSGSSSHHVTFIPYSSRSNWCYKYPMAFPNIHVDLGGNVSGYPYWSPEGSSGIMQQQQTGQQQSIPFASAAASSAAAFSGSGSGSFKLLSSSSLTLPSLPPLPIPVGTNNTEKLFPNASLSNNARSQLHSQIYTYLNWFKTELMIIQSSSSSSPNNNAINGGGGGGNGMNMMMDDNDMMMMNGPMINGIGNLLNMMEATFGESVTTNTAAAAGIGGGGGGNNKKRKASSQSMMARISGEDTSPLLERGLIEPLNRLVVESNTATAAGAGTNHDPLNEDEEEHESSLSSTPKRRKTPKSTTGVPGSGGGAGRGSGAGSGGNAPLDFDDMYNRLLSFKSQHGHVNVPQGYKEDKQLGSWVTNIRYKRKCLQKSGQEYEVEEDEEDNDLLGGGGGVDNMPEFAAATAIMMGIDLGMNSKKKDGSSSNDGKAKRKKKRLSQERIAQLDSIGFTWSHDKQYKSWEERFNDLQEYKRMNGNTRVPRSSGSMGEWVHMQRKMYHKNDKNFMAKRAPRLEAIGFEWRTRKYDLVSWDENFQNLVKFGTENQHYNVPSPMTDVEEGGPTTTEQEEANRFYKWVKRTRAEYKSLIGGKSSRMLTEDRVVKLRQIGFIV